jgi:Protein of unknown function (DUF2568)
MESVRVANLGLRFLLELALLAALAYWGWHERGVALAILLPLLAAVVWGSFVAPKARFPVSVPVRLAIELTLFGLAVAGLFAAGADALAIAFAVAVVLSAAINYGYR